MGSGVMFCATAATEVIAMNAIVLAQVDNRFAMVVVPHIG